MLRGLTVHTYSYYVRYNYTLAISYVRTVRADDDEAGNTVTPRDAWPQRLLLCTVAAVPVVSRGA